MDMRSTDGLRWFAVQVRAGREQHCANHLRLRGCEVFLPCYRETRRWSDRLKKVECALFAGYLFCRMDAEDLWQLARSPGVIRVVGDGRHPSPIPTHEIEAIQRVTAGWLGAEPWEYLQIGQRVQVQAGPMRGLEGVLLTVKNRTRLILSLSLLQRSVAVEVDAEWLEVPHSVWTPSARPCHAG